jgi:hypothetical protein
MNVQTTAHPWAEKTAIMDASIRTCTAYNHTTEMLRDYMVGAWFKGKSTICIAAWKQKLRTDSLHKILTNHQQAIHQEKTWHLPVLSMHFRLLKWLFRGFVMTCCELLEEALRSPSKSDKMARITHNIRWGNILDNKSDKHIIGLDNMYP